MQMYCRCLVLASRARLWRIKTNGARRFFFCSFLPPAAPLPPAKATSNSLQPGTATNLYIQTTMEPVRMPFAYVGDVADVLG